MNVFMTISYDGTNYVGWQRQKRGVSCQQVIEEGLKNLTGEEIAVTASGRTDAGVHAKAQVINFNTQSTIPPKNFYKALNTYLPNDIKATFSKQVDDTFNARKSAKKKTYCYTIYYSNTTMPLLDRYAVLEEEQIDAHLLKEASQIFIGEHDFKCFCASNSSVNSTTRTIYDIDIVENDGLLKIFVTGNGFLYNMVRTLVGTLIKMARGQLSKQQAQQMLLSKDRTLVGKTYPARGLTLEKVEY